MHGREHWFPAPLFFVHSTIYSFDTFASSTCSRLVLRTFAFHTKIPRIKVVLGVSAANIIQKFAFRLVRIARNAVCPRCSREQCRRHGHIFRAPVTRLRRHFQKSVPHEKTKAKKMCLYNSVKGASSQSVLGKRQIQMGKRYNFNFKASANYYRFE